MKPIKQLTFGDYNTAARMQEEGRNHAEIQAFFLSRFFSLSVAEIGRMSMDKVMPMIKEMNEYMDNIFEQVPDDIKVELEAEMQKKDGKTTRFDLMDV